MKKDILSVGIDIGTTTMSMIVSRLSITNTAASYRIPDVQITTKNILYKSPLYLTPQKDRELLDGDAIRRILEEEYRNAGITPEQVDTGAVIITGESSLKENAQIIADHLSTLAGEFVVATAGPDLESILAGRGSGAEAFSKQYGCVAANLDIGGGTTNVSVFANGILEGQTCIDAGGRLFTYDDTNTITYVSPRLNDLGTVTGDHWNIGEKATNEILQQAGRLLADTILESISPTKGERIRIATTKSSAPLSLTTPPQYVSFSGGVADCFYCKEQNLRKYGDVGPSIANALQEAITKSDAFPWTVVQPKETIRATVVGAGTYMTEVSGSTISYTEDLFPIKNLPMFLPSEDAEEALYQNNPAPLQEELRWYREQSAADRLGLCVRGKQRTAYEELKRLAEALLTVAAEEPGAEASQPLIIICENDMAKALGQVMRRFRKTNRPIVCLDCIEIRSGDYIDIGKPVLDGVALPVVVKTLIFG